MQTAASYNNKVRNPISVLDYLQDYSLVVYKVPISKNFSVSNISINNTREEINQTSEVIYSRVNGGIFNLWYRASENPPIADKIQLLVQVDSFGEVVKNDSLLVIPFDCKSFAIRYNDESTNDMCLNSINSKFPFSSCLLFIKRNNCLYMIFINSNKWSKKIDPDLLMNLIQSEV